MFVLCAAVQVLWAAAALLRRSRSVLLAGVLINGGALLVWALTRTFGIPFIDALATVESAGTQDGVAALFAAASVAGTARMLARPVTRTVIAPGWAGALAAVALLATMPALRAEHTHDHDDLTYLEAGAHGHGDDDDQAHGDDDRGHHDNKASRGSDDHGHGDNEAAHGEDGHDEAGDGHGHGGAATGALASHGHGSDGTTTHGDHPPAAPGAPNHPHPPAGPGAPQPPNHPHPPAGPGAPAPDGPIISLDDPRVTDAQRQIAQRLIDEATAALAGATVASIKAAGYSWIGDGGGGGYQHYVHWGYYTDGIELNPAKIESIVVKDGKIVSGTYILNPGKTMANVPPLAGGLTTWHDHQNLCFEGTTLVGLAVNGVCQRGTLTPTPPMLHVWLVPHPCGPFAGIETHGGGCGHGH